MDDGDDDEDRNDGVVLGRLLFCCGGVRKVCTRRCPQNQLPEAKKRFKELCTG